jgi:DNA (cytosine-5)-methyltransferase 1
MKHGSLFSGIGGFDLASEWMGWENVFHCEWNEFGKKILNHYWPKAISYGDITQTDFTIHRGQIDILTGGFPCQPFSQAGKRKGTEDSRHLWPEMLRVIREIRPTYIVGENVYGLINWSKGLVFEQVCVDLENEGYEVQPVILPACSVNAPHRRDRIWFVAHTTGYSFNNGHRHERQQRTQAVLGELPNEFKSVTNPNSVRRKEGKNRFEPKKEQKPNDEQSSGCHFFFRQDWQDLPTQSPICSRNDGLFDGLVGITVPKHRKESLMAYGDAIVPQVAFQIFKAIEQTE